ncbi:hypothetical protein AK812_SmicGene45993, partial [Symbiodinium microadriaticum]
QMWGPAVRHQRFSRLSRGSLGLELSFSRLSRGSLGLELRFCM